MYTKAMRKIRNKERKNGMKYCTFCKPKRVEAIYRDAHMNLACEEHKNRLSVDSGHLSEADNQTWVRI